MNIEWYLLYAVSIGGFICTLGVMMYYGWRTMNGY